MDFDSPVAKTGEESVKISRAFGLRISVECQLLDPRKKLLACNCLLLISAPVWAADDEIITVDQYFNVYTNEEKHEFDFVVRKKELDKMLAASRPSP